MKATLDKIGKRITIPASAEMMLSPGYKLTSLVPTYELIIGIGKDHVGRLIIEKEAHEALLRGEKMTTTTHA